MQTINNTLRCVAGLPRSGTTLLCSALDQSDDVYMEGTSGLWSLLAATLSTCLNDNSPYIKGRDRHSKTLQAVLPAIINAYYADAPKDKIIIDKSRGWNNAEFLQDFIKHVETPPKIVFMYRPVDEIFRSFGNLLPTKKRNSFYDRALDQHSVIPICVQQLINALGSKSKCFFFISYKDFVENFDERMSQIIEFFEIPKYKIEKNTFSKYQKDPLHEFGFKNLHRVRDGVSRQNIDIELPEHVLSFCHAANEQINLALNEAKR